MTRRFDGREETRGISDMSHQSDLISEDILAYLAQHERKELLRFLTCGNVDDGKSTLIGRLLHDSKMIYEDQLAAVTKDSTASTVPPARRSIWHCWWTACRPSASRASPSTWPTAISPPTKRKFIIADTPGHEQYTRNMATGASTAIWRSSWSMPATACRPRPSATVSSCQLLGIKHVMVAINKMDLKGFDEAWPAV
jgi:bifunctional enzyme CysN/CysC